MELLKISSLNIDCLAVPDDSLAAQLLHILQAPDQTAVKIDRLARNCQEGEAVEKEECKEEEVRRTDGRCNNIENMRWGSSHSPYRRLLPPSYSDSELTFRLSVSGSDLPSARAVSDGLARRGGERRESELTVHAMQWGQFLSHDMDHTPERAPPHITDCCGEDRSHPACAPITIPSSDSLYSHHGKTCINFIRSALAPATSCSTVDQQNQVTSYMDGSMVYGSDRETMLGLRELKGGRLKVSGDHLLEEASAGECQLGQALCFKSGDKRVNEQPGLVLYHVLWHREHNRLANSLATINPHWGDEELYQSARNILVASLQHITYSEYLPLMLGQQYMASILSTDQYNSSIDATVSNAFATAAFRFGHSMIPEDLSMADSGCPRKSLTSQPLETLFFNPALAHSPSNLVMCLAGLSHDTSSPPGPQFARSINGKLFLHRESGAKVGMDLVSINIQRGRDHGLPGYNAFRSLCGLPRAENFSDLSDVLTEEQISSLTSVYSHVDDIDLYIAGMMESPADGSLLGPTFSCIIADQMFRSRTGDRFFHSLKDSDNNFTEGL